MVPNTGAILDPPTPDQHDRVFLQIVSFTRNISRHRTTVGKLDTGDFANGRVGLLGLCGKDLAADALDEGFGFECGHFVDGRAVGFACATEVLLEGDGEWGGGGECASGGGGGQAGGSGDGATEERGYDASEHAVR